MSNNLSSPSINKAIGKLVKKHIDRTGVHYIDAAITYNSVVMVLDHLGYLGVLDYSKFNPDLLEQALQVGNHVLEVDPVSPTSTHDRSSSEVDPRYELEIGTTTKNEN